MNAIPGVDELSLMYGYFKLLDGPQSTDRDVYAVAKGEGSSSSSGSGGRRRR